MLVKRYVVREMPEAMSKIKEDLGTDAIILSTKKVHSKGLFGLFRQTQIEVVAAADRGQTTTTPQPRAQPVATSALATMPKQGGAVGQAASEVDQLKRMIANLLFKDSSQLPESVQAWEQRLRQNGISSEVGHRWMMHALQRCGDSVPTEERLKAELYEVISEAVQIHSSKLLATSSTPSDQRIIAFVGPTGVGKTTTIAKIAAMQSLREGKKVALITTDTYRIAAFEQLRTYAEILNIPVEVVFSDQDVPAAFERLTDRDLILVDTAGRNFTQQSNLSEVRKFLTAISPDETYLVLSLTHKSQDIHRIVNHFQEIGIDKLICTKLDETSEYGILYSLPAEFGIPVGYITMGQQVPDDIEHPSVEKLASLIMGDVHYG